MHKHIYIPFVAIMMVFAAPLASAAPHVSFSQHQSHHVQKKHKVRSHAVQGPVFIQYAQKKISPSQAKSIARNKVRGADVIDISFNGNVYKVRMQKKNGRVVDVYVDAATGRVR